MYSLNLLRDIVNAWRQYALYSYVIDPVAIATSGTAIANAREDRWNTAFMRYIDDAVVVRTVASVPSDSDSDGISGS